MRTRLIVCLDGVGPEYLAQADVPTIDTLGRRGWRTVGQAAMPSVTNVNNVSILTGAPSAVHGITANYYYDRARGEGVYMEDARFILVPTVLQRASLAGQRTALIAAKDKLRTLLSPGACTSFSAESPPAWAVEALGPPPPILSVEVNHWLLRAAALLCRRDPPDLLYLSTTDYAQHKHAPESEVSQANLAALDALLAALLDSGPEFALVLTADHGMAAKTRGLDLGQILEVGGIAAEAVPIIKDRYVAHHGNLGGAAYICLQDPGAVAEAAALLRDEPGVESVWARAAAAEAFHLHPERIGDLFVLATAETVFGALPAPRQEVSLRSHGGLHTRAVPIVGYGPGLPPVPPACNYQAVAWLNE
jgi:phosphonoacetate hydrolase